MGECRAGWTKHIVAGFDALARVKRDAVRARIATTTLEEVEGSLALRWLPLTYHVEILEAARDALGVEPYIRFWRDRTAKSLDHPLLFGKLGRSVVRRFAGNERRVVEAIPHALKHVLRNAGVMRVETGKDTTQVLLDRFPARLAGEGWGDAWVGALEAIAHGMVGEKVIVQLDRRVPEDGRFEWSIAWSGEERSRRPASDGAGTGPSA